MDFSNYSQETVKQQVSTSVLVEQQEISKPLTQSDQTFEDIQITIEKTPPSSNNDIPSQTQSEQEISQYQNSETQQLAKQAKSQLIVEFQNQGQMQVKIQDDFLEEFGFIQTQISSTISRLISDEKQYNIFRSLLSETLKYFPKPPPVDYNSDQEIQNYTENIKHLKEVCSHFLNFPLEFNSLQNKSSLLFKEFSRLQSQVSQSIIQHFSVSYILTKEDLGQLFNQIQHNQEKLEKVVIEWQALEQEVTDANIQTVVSNISQYYSQVFRMKQSKYQLTELDILNTEINSSKMEQQNKIDQVSRLFEYKMMTISLKENEIKLSQTKLKSLQQQFKDIQDKLNSVEKDIKNSFEMTQINQEKLQSDVRKSIDNLNKKRQDLMEDYKIDQSKKARNYSHKLTQLNNNYPIGSMGNNSGNQRQKEKFHYFVMIDESGSSTDAHDQAINGAIYIAQNISNQDSFTCIKFNSSATVKYPKTQRSNIDLNDLRNKIQYCACGGTSFLSAFSKLKKQIQNTVSNDEFPVVIFITDGQDGTDLTSIINSIFLNCGDILFYTVGYGSVNEKQLKGITDKFNRSSNQQREFNGRQVNLFYLNQTPETLYKDLLQISNEKVSIEDIKQAKEFFEESYNQEVQNLKAFYYDLEKQIDKEIKILLEKENQLKSEITRELFQLMHQKSIEAYKQVLDELSIKIDKERKKIYTCQNTIDSEKVNLIIQFSDQQQNEQYNYSMIQGLDFKKLLFNKNLSIENEYKGQRDQFQQQINQIKKENEEKQSSLKQVIKDLGFQNESHFLKFDSLYQDVSNVQIFYSNMIQKYIVLSQQLMDIDGMLQSQIDLSNYNINNTNYEYNQQIIFKYYLRFDPTINVLDEVDAKKKILLICNSSILEHCKEIQLEKFYNKTIVEIHFNDLFGIADKKKEEQDSYIKDQLIPYMLKPLRVVNKLKTKKQQLPQKIKKLERQIKYTTEEIKEEQDESTQQDLKEDLKEQKDDLKSLQEELQEIESQFEEEWSQFFKENCNEIKVITQISQTLLKAIQVASIKQKQFVSIMPFFQYVEISNQSNSAINGYRPLAIKS